MWGFLHAKWQKPQQEIFGKKNLPEKAQNSYVYDGFFPGGMVFRAILAFLGHDNNARVFAGFAARHFSQAPSKA